MDIITPGNDVIARFSQIAGNMANLPPAVFGTPEERRPNYALDLATVHPE